MIGDFQCNKVYFSEHLGNSPKFRDTCAVLTALLDKHKIDFGFLPETADIWARDYMPIQISQDDFVEYRYDPDYLQGARHLKTYPDLVAATIGLKTRKTRLILDGGNIVKSENSVILTDKAAEENRISKKALRDALENLFKTDKIILIPWDSTEPYGHSDGMLRFINEDSVLLSHFYKNDKALIKLLESNKLNVEILEFSEKPHKMSWAYVNFLQTEKLLILPVFDSRDDEELIRQMKYFYPNQVIETVNATEIAKGDGAFNCISWTIKV